MPFRSYCRSFVRLWVCALLCVIGCLSAYGEVVVLRSGQHVSGEIMVHNEEVVVIRTKSGTRFQYPASEVVAVEQEQVQHPADNEPVKPVSSAAKHVAIHAGVAGGAACLPMVGWGGYTGADLLVGTHSLMQRRILLGGGLGVHAAFVGDNRYAFIPLQLAAHIPLTGARHAPVMGMALGYGFSVSHNAKGGIYTGLDVGWKYCFSDKASLSLTADVQWQQLSVSVSEQVDGNLYSNYIGTNMLMLGLKLGVQF